MTPRLIRHDDGATAIEYALIAGLVALGIVGSLVSTRTSLSSVFGTASSQMNGSDSAAAVSAYASRPVQTTRIANYGQISKNSAHKEITYTYGDGSTVLRTLIYDTDGKLTQQSYQYTDKTANTRSAMTYNAAGVQTSAEFQQIDSSTQMIAYSLTQQGAGATVRPFGPQAPTDPDAAFAPISRTLTTDSAYFATLVTNLAF